MTGAHSLKRMPEPLEEYTSAARQVKPRARKSASGRCSMLVCLLASGESISKA